MKKGKYRGIILISVLSLLSGLVFYINPELASRIYTNGIFAFLRIIFGRLPTLIIVLFWLLFFIAYLRSRSHSMLSIFSLTDWLKRIFPPILILIILFYWLWGFNYFAIKPEVKILGPDKNMALSDAVKEFKAQTKKVNLLRASLGNMDPFIGSGDSIIRAGNNRWVKAVTDILGQNGFNVNTQAQIKSFSPSGTLLRLGTAGFYNFFIVRPMTDPSLHPLQIPNVCAHELAHAYGVSDEGSANFIAWLACSQSSDTFTRYSTELSLWLNLRDAAYLEDSVSTKNIYAEISPAVKSDLVSIRKQMDKFPDIAPALRDAIYNLFLESQGIDEGIASYDRYVSLVLAWKKLYPEIN